MSNAGSLHAGKERTQGGLSHSCERPTRLSPAPSAQTISVALARSETIRIPHTHLLFRQQSPRFDVEFVLRLAVQVAASRTGKTGVNPAHLAFAIDEQGCRPGIPILQLVQL